MIATHARIIGGFVWEDSEHTMHHAASDQEFPIFEYLPNEHMYVLDIEDNTIHKTACFFYDQVIPNH